MQHGRDLGEGEHQLIRLVHRIVDLTKKVDPRLNIDLRQVVPRVIREHVDRVDHVLDRHDHHLIDAR